MSKNDVEGLVVKTGNHRYKVKTGEYIRLHRIVTEYTAKKIWESLSTGASLEFQNMPEEFQKWLDETINILQSNYDKTHDEVVSIYESTKSLSDKELGLAANVDHKGIVYSLRNGKNIEESIWKLVKPREGSAEEL